MPQNQVPVEWVSWIESRDFRDLNAEDGILHDCVDMKAFGDCFAVFP